MNQHERENAFGLIETDNSRTERIENVILDHLQRWHSGDDVSDGEVIAEHPKLMPELAERLQEIAELSSPRHDVETDGNDDRSSALDPRSLRIRCPHCRQSNEVLTDADFDQVTCASCGSQYSLACETVQTWESPSYKRIAQFELVERLGLGSFGTVWKARDTELDRTVAVKIPRRGQLDPGEIEKFLREARAAAQLNHKNIVRVYEVGRDGDTIYIVNELIRGVTLADWLTGRQPTFRQAAELSAEIADALHHAHKSGVIHRDLKPQNIMLGEQNAPCLMDFGLAKREASEVTMTLDGHVLGTPAYMSPEQAQGKSHQADRRSDIYSLGVILFELLTSELPYRGNARMLIHQMIHDQPPSPRRLNNSIPRDLETICLKCLEKEPGRRYEWADDLAVELRRFLNGEPIQARPISTVARTWRWCERQPAVASLTASVALLLLFLAVVGPIVAVSQARSRHNEQDARQQAEEERDLAISRQYEARLAQVRAGRRSGQVGRRFESLKALQEATRLARQLRLDESAWMDLRNEAIASLALFDVELIKDWEGWDDDEWPAFDANLRHYAKGDLSGNIRIFRVADGRELSQFVAPEKVPHKVKFSPDGDLLATSSRATLLVWDWRNKNIIFRAPFPSSPTFDLQQLTCFRPDSMHLAVCSSNGIVAVFDLTSGQEVTRIKTSFAAENLAYSPDCRRLAVSSSSRQIVQVWNLAPGDIHGKLAESSFRVGAGAGWLAWRPHTQSLAISDGDNRINIWDVETVGANAVLRGHHRGAKRLQFSPEGDVLCSWAWDGTVRLWNPEKERELFQIAGIDGWLSADGRRLVCSRGNRFLLWRLAKGNVCRILPTRTESVRISLTELNTGSLTSDGRWLAVPSGVAGIAIFDLWQGKPVAQLPTAGYVLFHPNGQELFISGANGVSRQPFSFEDTVLRIGAPEQLANGRKGKLGIDSAGRFLVYTDPRGAAEVLDLNDTDSSAIRVAHRGCASVAISADARWIATGTHSGYGVKVWEATTGELVETLLPASKSVNVYFSPDGRWLVTVNRHGGIDFWEMGSWTHRRRLAFATRGSAALTWSRDGKLLACASSRHRVQLQDAVSGQPLATLEAPDDYQVDFLTLTPDGSQLYVWTAVSPTHVRVWDLRLLRKQLAEMDLDWDATPFPPPTDSQQGTARLHVQVDLGDLSHR